MNKKKPAVLTVLYQTIMLIISITAIYPFVFIIMNALKNDSDFLTNKFGLPATISWENFSKAWNSSNIDIYFTNTFIIVAVTTILCVLLSSLAGFAFAKLRFPFKRFLFYFSLSFLIIPFTVILTPFYNVIVQSGLINTYTGMVLVYVAFSMPFGIYLMTQYYKGIPDELMQASYIDGASLWGVFIRIMLPLGLPAQVTLAILTFLSSWNDLILSLLVLQKGSMRTLSVGIATMSGEYMTSVPLVSAAMVISILPILIIFIFLQKHLVSGVTLGAVK